MILRNNTVARRKDLRNDRKKSEYSKLVVLTEPDSLAAESYKELRTQLAPKIDQKQLSSLLITSSESNTGKSVLASNLAILLAQTGYKTLIIDVNFNNPSLDLYFYPSRNSISEYLVSDNPDPIDKYYSFTSVDNLFILSCRKRFVMKPDPFETEQFNTLMTNLNKQFDIILFDGPAALNSIDTQVLSEKVDGTLLVVKRDTTRKKELQLTQTYLNNAGASILGVVMNTL